ncbi:PREDICTED: uncharacterized protein LOC105361162, partial [Ceratosolen solmsi marchali]|uniref:Uncharacterized protein LOC105361162 n=1 Tax=Ceratosolen solmsi marchali TaxID=326594 RepID=A0AAJ6YEG0_9HYME
MLKWNKTRIFKDTIFNKNTLRMFSENIDVNKLTSKHIKLKYSQKQLMFTFKELRQHDFKELKNLYNIPPNEIKKVKEMQDKSKSVDSLNNFLSNAKVNIFQLNKVCSIIRKEKLKTHAGVISTIVGSNHIENVQTAVGLRMGINNVSWCEVNLNDSNLDVLCWKSKTFYNVDSSADPLEMMKIGTAIANSIQKTNNYIMERDKIMLKLPKSNSTLYRLVLRQQQIASVILTTLFKTNA